MKAKDDLFTLVRSLQQTEKRYFKVFASQNEKQGSNIYLKLFDAIDQQREYNEKAIREKFRKEHFIKHLAATKYYLQKLIIKSLTIYHNNNSVAIRLNNVLTSIEILFNKGLFDLCLKLIVRSKYIASHKESYIHYIELLRWEKKVMLRKQFTNAEGDQVSNITGEEKDAMKKLSNMQDYQNIHMNWWYQVNKKGTSRSALDSKPYALIKADPLVKDIRRALTNRSMITYYNINTVIGRESGDMKTSILFREKAVDLFLKNPGLAEREPESCITSVSNLALGYYFLKQYKRSIQVTDQIKTMLDPRSYKDSEIIQTMVLESTISNKASCFNRLGDLKNVIALIPEFETGRKKLARTINKARCMIIIYNFSCAFLGIGDHKKALRWVNEILHDHSPENEQDVHAFARIIHLIIHYEMKNEELLEYIVRSTYRYFYKRNRLYKLNPAY